MTIHLWNSALMSWGESSAPSTPHLLGHIPRGHWGDQRLPHQKARWGAHPDRCAYSNRFFFPFAFPMMTVSYLLGRAGSNILNCWRKFSQLIKLLCVLCWSKILFMSYAFESTKEWMKKELFFWAGRQWNDDWWDYALTLLSAQCQ